MEGYMADNYRAERTVSAVFKEQDQVDAAVRRLMNRGVPSDHISVMGKNFQSQTRIAGFISKKDVILGGLRTGAIFGSLFGSFLSLLTGVGVLLIPFVGPVVSAGPLSAVLLGAASGALAGSAGAIYQVYRAAWGAGAFNHSDLLHLRRVVDAGVRLVFVDRKVFGRD